MSSLALGIAGAGVALEAYQGFHQQHEANEIQKNLKTPVDVIPQEFYDNREIARQMAQIGLPQQQYNNAVNGINQNQAAGIVAASRSSNPGAAIQGIVHQGDAAKSNLNAEDAQARENNQRYFVQENAALGQRKDQQEQANVFDPYTRQFNQMQAYRGAGMQNLNSAIGGLSSIGMESANFANNKTPQTAGQVNGIANLDSASGSGVTPSAYTPSQNIPAFNGTRQYIPGMPYYPNQWQPWGAGQ